MDERTTLISERPQLAERFEFVRTLGEGAAGEVYLVRDKMRDNRELALKVLVDSSAFDEHTLERFQQEISASLAIHHPNIVQAYDVIPLENTLAFTMEYVPGTDLGHLFRKKKLDFEEIDKIFVQLLSALEELHRRGIVHRDLKLENILVQPDGTVKLSDLGLLKRLDTQGFTRTGVLLGTAQYFPPEYIQEGKYDQRGDLYATGTLLFELLTQKRRLADKNGAEAIQHLMKTRFEIPRMALSGLPKKYIRIIEKSMAIHPEHRFQSAHEMRQAFLDKDFSGASGENASIRAGVDFQPGSPLVFDVPLEAASHPVFRGAKIAGTTLLLILALGIGLRFFLRIQNLRNIPPGKYEGRLIVNSWSAGAGSEIKGRKDERLQVVVDQRGLSVTSPLLSCERAVVGLLNQRLECSPSKRYALEIRSSGLHQYDGALSQENSGNVYTFTLSPTESKDGEVIAK